MDVAFTSNCELIVLADLCWFILLNIAKLLSVCFDCNKFSFLKGLKPKGTA